MSEISSSNVNCEPVHAVQQQGPQRTTSIMLQGVVQPLVQDLRPLQ